MTRSKPYEGSCPGCGGKDLDRHSSRWQAPNLRFYYFTCCDCGQEGVEVYEEVYQETQFEKGVHENLDCPDCGTDTPCQGCLDEARSKAEDLAVEMAIEEGRERKHG